MAGSEAWLTPLVLTLKVAGLATLVSFALGVGCARLLTLRDFPGSALISSLLSLPLILPPTVLGYYLLVVIGKDAAFGRFLEERLGITLLFTWQGAVFATSVVAFPMILSAAKAAFEGVDRNLENAARTLGTSELMVFFRVSLPLAWRGIFAGTLLAFARGMGEFGATMMVAGNIPGKTQTLSLAVAKAVQNGDANLASTLAVVMSILCVAVLVGSEKLLGAKGY